MRDAERVEVGHRYGCMRTAPAKNGSRNRMHNNQKPVPMELQNILLRKLTHQERGDCMNKGLCSRCRKKGHFAKNAHKERWTNRNHSCQWRHFRTTISPWSYKTINVNTFWAITDWIASCIRMPTRKTNQKSFWSQIGNKLRWQNFLPNRLHRVFTLSIHRNNSQQRDPKTA